MSRRLAILATLVLVAYSLTGVYQVSPGEQAVVRRFGEVIGPPRLPGLHWGLPWGLDRVDAVAVDTQRELVVGYLPEEGPETGVVPLGQLLTGDNNLLNLRLTVAYRVDPEAVVSFVLNRERIEPLVARLTEEAMLETVASQRIDPILFGQARTFEQELWHRLDRRLASYGLGVIVDQVNVRQAEPPAELVETFREVNRARTRREIIEREALSLRGTEISLARQNADQTRAEAGIAAERMRSSARAEAESFLILLRSLPTKPAERHQALLDLYMDKMKEVLSKVQVRTLSGTPADQHIILPGATRNR